METSVHTTGRSKVVNDSDGGMLGHGLVDRGNEHFLYTLVEFLKEQLDRWLDAVTVWVDRRGTHDDVGQLCQRIALEESSRMVSAHSYV